MPFDRSYTTFYWSAIVNIASSCTVFELFDVEEYRHLEIWVRGHLWSFKRVPFESLGAVSCLPSIVTMAVSCVSSEIKRNIGRKSRFFSYPLHSNIAIPFGVDKPEWWGYPMVKKNYEDMYNRLDRIPACDCDRWTDRQTDGRTRDCHCVRSLLFVYRISSKLVGSCVRPPPDGHNCY